MTPNGVLARGRAAFDREAWSDAYGQLAAAEVLTMATKYDHIIIDAGGRDTTSQRAALSVSGHLLIPCKPRSFDLWAIENVAQLVNEARVINHP